ncbi:hypothetical protein ACWDTI_03520 [Gordonia sp. NPDC003424]
MVQEPTTSRRGYAPRLTVVLCSALFIWSGVMPVAQFIASLGVPSFAHRELIVWAFGVHAVVWLLAVRRRGPVWTPVATWGLVCLVLAMSSTGPDVAGQRIVLDTSLTVGIAAALVCPRRPAVLVAAVLSVSAGLLVADSYYALLIPVYTICSTLAVAIVTGGLREVAELADRSTVPRRGADAALLARPSSWGLTGVRARLMHDTVINTLGAVARGVIVSDLDAIRRRCVAEFAALDELERLNVPDTTGLDDILAYARALGVDVAVDSPGTIEALLGVQPPWRRREIIGLLVESITNAAKHSGSDSVEVGINAPTGHITIRDRGVGVVDLDRLRATLAWRAADAMITADVDSAAGAGTTVTLIVPPLESIDGQGVLTRAATEMVGRLVPVMLVEFAIVAVVATAFGTGWSLNAVLPAALLWTITATLLTMVTTAGRRGPHLPATVIGVGYLLMLAGVLVATSAAVVPPNMAWAGDAAATACIAFIVVDGRARVFLPPVLAGVAAVCWAMITGADPGGSTIAVLIADVAIVTVFVIVRRGLVAMAIEIERRHRIELRRREEKERRASRLHTVDGESVLARARMLLGELARHPERIVDPRIRDGAGVEEGCLRAMIAIWEHEDHEWTRIITAARMAGVVLDLHFFTADHPVPRNTSPSRIEAVAAAIARCRPGESVSVSVFAIGPDMRVDVVAGSLPNGFAEIGADA